MLDDAQGAGTQTQDPETEYVKSALAQGQAAQAAQPAAAQAPQQQATPPSTGDPEADYVSGIIKKDETPGLTDKIKSYWNDRNSWHNRSLLVDAATRRQLDKEDALGQQIINHEIASAHPWRAALAQFYYGSLKDAADLAEQLTTPAQLALMIGGTALRGVKFVKSALMAANAYFAYQGGKAMTEDSHAMATFLDNAMQGKLEGDPEAVQRFLYGAGGFTMGVAGAGAEAKDIIRARVQKNLGLSGNLADKVSQQAQEVDSIRQKAIQEATQVHGQTRQDVEAAEQAGGQKAAQMTTEAGQVREAAPLRLGQIMEDAGKVVVIAKAQGETPFEDMYRAHPEPVTDTLSLRASLLDTIKSHGVQEHEIPPKIFDALVNRGKGSNEWMDIPKGPISETIPDIKTGLQEINRPVDQQTLARVNQDLWQASRATKDGNIRLALEDARHSVNKMRQEFADRNGFGPKFSKAMANYKQFQRDLGSGVMNDFLEANDFQDEHMAKRMANIISPTQGAALRDLLKTFGVDTKPLQDLIAHAAELEEGAAKVPAETKRNVGAIRTAGKERILEIGKTAQGNIEDLGKSSPIIPEAPGLTADALRGKTDLEIREAAMKELARNMKSSGISRPYAYIQIAVGTLRMMLGSQFGMMTAGMGAGRLASGWRASTVKNPAFQDWVIRESGVEPNNTALIQKMRGSMDRWYPYLRMLEKTGAPARAAVSMAQRRDNSPTSFRTSINMDTPPQQ